MSDRSQLFVDLLRYVEGATWDFEAQDLKDILLTFLFEIPALRKALAETDVKPENEMDTVLKRALHHLERFADLYHSSPVDKVVAEIRQLITEEKSYQVEGETLEFELPKWQYDYTLFNPTMNYIAHFNKRGGDGWELIHCDFDKGHAVFKRPK